MEPERTTTIGDGESAITESPFHIMKAVESIRPKLRSCAAACRGFWRAESMVVEVYRRVEVILVANSLLWKEF
jgi:hypothetical protein